MPKSIIFFLLFSFSGLFAQTVKISGNIKSSDSQNLVGANVFLEVNKKQWNVATDVLGNFSKNISSGRLVIKVNHSDFISKTIEFDILKDTVIAVVLEKDISQLKEVIVSSDKKNQIKNLSGGRLSFNLKELNAVPTLLGTTDVIKLLQLTPGVQNSGDANGYLYVRGGDPGHNAIYIMKLPFMECRIY